MQRAKRKGQSTQSEGLDTAETWTNMDESHKSTFALVRRYLENTRRDVTGKPLKRLPT
jgi:hypothetical protein